MKAGTEMRLNTPTMVTTTSSSARVYPCSPGRRDDLMGVSLSSRHATARLLGYLALGESNSANPLNRGIAEHDEKCCKLYQLCRCRDAGSSNRTVAPAPAVPLMRIVPSCINTIFRASG